MKLELYRDGKLEWTFETTDGANDIVALPRVIANECSMSFTAFENIFTSYIGTSKTNLEAYHRAEEKHIEILGRKKYSDYLSFLNTRSQKRKHDRTHR